MGGHLGIGSKWKNFGSNANVNKKASLMGKAFNNRVDKMTLFVNVGQPLPTVTPASAQ